MYVYAFRAPYPVSLHYLHPLGPVGEFIQILEEPLGVIGYPEKPLLEVFLRYRRIAPFAFSLYDLFVGKNRITGRAPIHERFLFIREALFQKL